MKFIVLVLLFTLPCTRLTAEEDVPSAYAWPVPEKENRPGCYWWWPGSAVDRENITWNLETMCEAGMGGGLIVPIYGVKGCEERFIPYLSMEWLEMLDHAVREAERMGMWLDMTTGTGWPFGGPRVPAEDADAVVVYDEGKMGQKFSGRKVKRAAPGGEGYALNPYSKGAMEHYLAHFDEAFSKAKIRLPRAQYHDSFEYRGNWCHDLLEEFQTRRGYDLADHLEALFGTGEADKVARIKHDYRETLSDLHLQYIETWNRWAHERGCLTRNQAHGAPANLLDLYAASDMPETETFGATPFEIPGLRREPDNVRKDRPQPLINRLASSAAHVTGRPLVASETCTWVRNHFRTALSQVKPEIDQLFLCGINHIFYHGCCYSPKDAAWPGWLFYASLEANPRNAIWRDLPELNRYITRCQSILQAGCPDNQILLYWPIHDLWYSSEGMQQQLTVHRAEWLLDSPCGKTAQWLLDQGYAFDFISDRQLMACTVLPGDDALVSTQAGIYRAILVPRTDRMPLASLRRLSSLFKEGADVIFMESLPRDVPGFNALKERRAAQGELIKDLEPLVAKDSEALHKRLQDARVVHEALADFNLGFIRRTHGEGYHYFVANLGSREVDGWIPMGVALKSAVIMDPHTSLAGKAGVRDRNGRQELYLQMQPGETRIIRTFSSKEIQGQPWPYLSPTNEPFLLSGEWQVTFVEGGPELPGGFTTSALESWTELGDEEATRFAGTARYRLAFDLPDRSAADWVLHLGEVRESARIFINSRRVGALFSIPYTLRVGGFLRPGRNLLEVEVTNLSANRIRDLDRRKVKWKIFHNINFVDHNYRKFDAASWTLIPSGLMGPVRLTPMKAKEPGP